MCHELYDVTGFAIVGPYTLRISFDDHTNKTIDFWPMLRGELYGPLRDRAFFERVQLDQGIARSSGLTAPISIRQPYMSGTLWAKR